MISNSNRNVLVLQLQANTDIAKNVQGNPSETALTVAQTVTPSLFYWFIGY
jgi:hypothetical protein